MKMPLTWKQHGTFPHQAMAKMPMMVSAELFKREAAKVSLKALTTGHILTSMDLYKSAVLNIQHHMYFIFN